MSWNDEIWLSNCSPYCRSVERLKDGEIDGWLNSVNSVWTETFQVYIWLSEIYTLPCPSTPAAAERGVSFPVAYSGGVQ